VSGANKSGTVSGANKSGTVSGANKSGASDNDNALRLRYGVDLGMCNPTAWKDVAQAADELGYESVWLPEHLIFPAVIEGAPGHHADIVVSPHTPLYDPFVMLASLAASTTNIRLGTNVYNIGLRHPFVTARAVATLDIVSGGRVDLGIGVSWLAAEWEAAQLDFTTRGARADEIIDVCRRLWTEPTVAHDGRFFSFGDVVFEPKPVQARVPMHMGGDSTAAMRRAVRLGEGWMGMVQDTATFAVACAELAQLAEAAGRDPASLQRTMMAREPDAAERERWAQAGATRLIVAPWERTSGAIEGLRRFAAAAGIA
jgi:probable F420-dependent oxidoreductase